MLEEGLKYRTGDKKSSNLRGTLQLGSRLKEINEAIHQNNLLVRDRVIALASERSALLMAVKMRGVTHQPLEEIQKIKKRRQKYGDFADLNCVYSGSFPAILSALN